MSLSCNVGQVQDGALEFDVARPALGLLGNRREVQFRLTARYQDGSYFTNFDER